jgi:hypothetical protein
LIIWLDDDVFADSAACCDVDRIALLRGAARRHHCMLISAHPDQPPSKQPGGVLKTWLQGLSSPLRRELELIYQQLRRVYPLAVTRGANRLLIAQRDPGFPGCWIKLDTAVRAVSLPLFVLVESCINDSSFLRRALPPSWAGRLEDWEKAGQLRFEHGGGQNLETIIERFTEDDYCRKAFGTPADVWKVVHFIVCDRDAEQGQMGQLANGVSKRCAAARMQERLHVLERWSQESYIPKEAALELIERHGLSFADRTRLRDATNQHYDSDDRYGQTPKELESVFKNAFSKDIAWNVGWFEADECWPEMTRLAEAIAAAL